MIPLHETPENIDELLKQTSSGYNFTKMFSKRWIKTTYNCLPKGLV